MKQIRERWLYPGFAILLALLSNVTDVQGGESRVVLDSVEANLSMSAPDTIIINEQFSLRFSVNVTGDVFHFNNKPDLIKFFIPPCFHVDSGSVEWSGRLERGSSVELELLVRAVSPCIDYFAGTLRTGCYDRTPIQYKTRNTIRTRNFHVLGDATILSGSVSDSNVNYQDSNFRVLDTFDVGPKSVFPNGLKIVSYHIEDSIPSGTQYPLKIAAPSITMEMSLDSLISRRARLTYYRGATNIVKIYLAEVPEGDARRWLLPNSWGFSSPNCSLAKYKGSGSVLLLDESLDSVRLQMTVENDTIEVMIDIQELR